MWPKLDFGATQLNSLGLPHSRFPWSFFGNEEQQIFVIGMREPSTGNPECIGTLVVESVLRRNGSLQGAGESGECCSMLKVKHTYARHHCEMLVES